MLQNGHILPGKVRKSVNVKGIVFCKVAVFQLFQKPGHLISGIPLSPDAQRVVAFHNQGQLFQFLGEASLQGMGCLGQVLGRNAASFEFIDGIHQPA